MRAVDYIVLTFASVHVVGLVAGVSFSASRLRAACGPGSDPKVPSGLNCTGGRAKCAQAVVLVLVMASLASVHLSSSISTVNTSCRSDEGFSSSLWLGLSLMVNNLLLFVALLFGSSEEHPAGWDEVFEKSSVPQVARRLPTVSWDLPEALTQPLAPSQKSPETKTIGAAPEQDLSTRPSTPERSIDAKSKPEEVEDGILPITRTPAGALSEARRARLARRQRGKPAGTGPQQDPQESPETPWAEGAGPLRSSTVPAAELSPLAAEPRRKTSSADRGGSRLKDLASRASPDNQWLARRKVLQSGESLPGIEGAVEILHVDDDPVQHIILAKWFRSYVDVVVTPAKSGGEALALLEERFSRTGTVTSFPSLLVMDQMMPVMTGTQTASTIRERYPLAVMPIIIASDMEADEIRTTSEYLASGVNDFLTKPIKKQAVTSTVACQLSLSSMQRKNNILNNILPESIINRLAAGQTVIADRHEEVSILFSDVVGYTALAAKTQTPDLIQILNLMFSAFDRLSDKHGVYKVETIGDAYMAAAGHCPESAGDHSLRLINMAADMISVAEGIELPDGTTLRIRVGVHTGSAYAGVVGQKCPRYCFFGDTVNTASRMESTSFSQCLQVSGATHSHVVAHQQQGRGNDIRFCPLGSRAIKGKGEMETYLVKAGEWMEAHYHYMHTGVDPNPKTPKARGSPAGGSPVRLKVWELQ